MDGKMDTPTMQRLTRSKARSQSSTAEKGFASQRRSKKAETPAERAPFCDLTNNSDSPIAGFVPGKPCSPSRLKRTQGKKGSDSPQQDGEEVLRSQVRALLDKQSPGVDPLPAFHLPSDDLSLVHSPCSVTKKAPTPANTPVTSSSGDAESNLAAGGSVNKGLEGCAALVLQAIEKLEIEAAQTTDDEGSPPPAAHSITRALRFDTADSPNALIVRTPVVASWRLKSVVVVPSPEEGAKSMSGSEDGSAWSMMSEPDSPVSKLQQPELQWSMEVHVSSPDRYQPSDDSDAEREEGPSGPKEEAPSQISTIPLMNPPLALGDFSPVPAPRVAWRRHLAASNKIAVMFEDLPVGSVEEGGPEKAEEVQPLVPQPPVGVKKVGGGTFPLLRRALHNDSAKKQKDEVVTPAKPTADNSKSADGSPESPIPAWYGTPTAERSAGESPISETDSPTKELDLPIEESELDSEALDGICEDMESLQVADGRVFLRGVPLHEGAHLRFDCDGEEKGKLKGLPTPTGMHTRFE